MTNAKNVYVLLLALIIVLSGCFGMTSDETDAQDSGSEENGEQENDSNPSESQDRIWYTSGGIYERYWNEDNVSSDGQYCIDWDHTYSSETGEIIETDCDGTDRHESIDDWDTSECTEAGGLITPNDSSFWGGNISSAPTCTIEFATINTSAGEALLIYDLSNVAITTTCDGVSQSSYFDNGKEYSIIEGSAMDCSHLLYKTLEYDQENEYSSNEQLSQMRIWSIVYAIQDVTVV